MLRVPVDGFTLNPSLRDWPCDYAAGALAQMEVLRRANTYRARIFSVPDDFNQPLAAYETLEYQIKATSGSYLWGILFRQFDAAWAAQDPTNVVVQITEACTGIPLLSEFGNPDGYAFYAASPLGRGIQMPHILNQPRLFLDPADINVELCNNAATTQRCQLLLFFAEPSEVIA